MRVVTQVLATTVIDFFVKFAAAVLMARYLGPTDKGVLAFAQLIIAWVVTLGNLSIYEANIFLLGSKRFSVAEVSSTTLMVSMISGLLYALVLFGLVWFHVVSWAVGQPIVLYLLVWTIPFALLTNNLIAILQGMSLFREYNVLVLVRSSSLFVSVLFVIRWCPDRLMGFVYANVITTVAVAMVLAVYLARLAEWKFRISFQFVKEAVQYGVRGYLRVVLTQVSLVFDKFVLGTAMDPAYLGWYSVAVGLSGGLVMFPDAAGLVLFPRVAGNQASGAALAASTCRRTLMIMVAGALAGIVLGRPVIRLLYGEPFLPSVLPFYVLMVAAIFQALSRVLRFYLLGMGRPQLTLWSTGAAALATAVFIYPLVRHFGMMGAAFVSLLAQMIGAGVDLMLAARLSTFKMRRFIVPEESDVRLATWKP